MSFGLQVYNSSGFVQFDTTESQYKNFVLESTSFLSVSNTGSSITMDSYLAQDNTALQNVTQGDLILVRPTNSNMFPFTMCLYAYNGFLGDVDVAVRSSAAGTVEIRRYVAAGDTDFSTLVSGLPANRYGLQLFDESQSVIYDADLNPPRISNVIQTSNSYQNYSGSIPLCSLNGLV